MREGSVELNADRTDDERLTLVVVNTGDRPVQIGSHLHLPDANTALDFDREAAHGLPARHPVRHLAAVRAGRVAGGGRGRPARQPAGAGASSSAGRETSMAEISRAAYAALYGPTVGDQVRLGDTDLWIEVEQDLTVGGEEVVFGGGKSIRESMGQGTTTRAEGAPGHGHHQRAGARLVGHRPRRRRHPRRPDRRARPGREPRHRRRRAPRPADRAVDRRDRGRGADPHRRRDRLARPPALAVAAARGARHRDHHHRRRRHRAERGVQGDHRDARARGTCGAIHRALDPLPVNVLLLGKGNTVSADGLAEQALAGAAGYKVHEDWGSTPAAIDAALRAADEWGLQVALHSDSLNEAGFVESTVRRDRGSLDPRLPRRGRGRRARAGHPVAGRVCRT